MKITTFALALATASAWGSSQPAAGQSLQLRGGKLKSDPCEAVYDTCKADETAIPYVAEWRPPLSRKYGCKCIKQGQHLLPDCPPACSDHISDDQGQNCCEIQGQGKLCALNGRGNTCRCDKAPAGLWSSEPSRCKIDMRVFHSLDLSVGVVQYSPAIDGQGQYKQSNIIDAGLIVRDAAIGTINGAIAYSSGAFATAAVYLTVEERVREYAQAGLVLSEEMMALGEVELAASTTGALPAAILGAVTTAVAVGIEVVEKAVNEKSWEPQQGCVNWCREQATKIPFLKSFKTSGKTVQLEPHQYRPKPYNLVDGGVVIGRGTICNNDITDDEYCKQGCTVAGKQMPCTVVARDISSAYDKGFMFDKNGNTVTNTPKISDESGPIHGCTSGAKYCCCIDKMGLDNLEKTPGFHN